MRSATADVLVVIDLQRVVGPGRAWELPGLDGILPRVGQLLRAYGPRSVLTRHRLAAAGPGSWAAFAARWAGLDDHPDTWELLDEVAREVPTGAAVVDKHTYSAFDLAAVQERLGDPPGRLVIAGCETDCCVAATMFAAVDAGVEVVLAADALLGPDPSGHRAMLRAAGRLPEQVQIVRTEHLLTP